MQFFGDILDTISFDALSPQMRPRATYFYSGNDNIFNCRRKWDDGLVENKGIHFARANAKCAFLSLFRTTNGIAPVFVELLEI